MADELGDVIALGRRVLGVEPGVEVEARAVLEEDVRVSGRRPRSSRTQGLSMRQVHHGGEKWLRRLRREEAVDHRTGGQVSRLPGTSPASGVAATSSKLEESRTCVRSPSGILVAYPLE